MGRYLQNIPWWNACYDSRYRECGAILTLAGAETKVATTDFNVRFLAPCNTGVVCHGKVLKFGRTLCPAEAEIRDENKKLVAVAQATYIRL